MRTTSTYAHGEIFDKRRMTLLVVQVLIYTAFGAQAFGQNGPEASVLQTNVHFWAFLLSSIANPAEPPRELQTRETIFVNKFGLNSAEAAALHNVAAEFAQAAIVSRNQASEIVANKTVLSVSDQAALATLTASQNQAIATWANEFLKQCRPVVASRIARVIR